MMNLNGKDFVHVNGGVFPPCFIQKPIQFCLDLFYVGYKVQNKRKYDWKLRTIRSEFEMKVVQLLQKA